MYDDWYQSISDDVVTRARGIKLLICDIDGVFSDGSIYMGNDGEELKTFNTKDGFGVKALMNAGVDVAVITGRSSNIVTKRMNSLGVKYLYQGMENKIQGYRELLNDLALQPEQVAYIGDDFPDIPVMKVAGLAVAVADAHPFAKANAHIVTTLAGGRGAVRELTDLLVMAQRGEDYLVEHLEGFSK
jgi:3-deoxy-D-manno-octulosonate 8-phosphate phosphatase (KDO 8-P phosphatase)